MISSFIKANSTWILAGIVVLAIIFSSTFLQYPHGLPESKSETDITELWKKAPNELCNVDAQHAMVYKYFSIINNGGTIYDVNINEYSLIDLYTQQTGNQTNCVRDVSNYTLGYIYLLQKKDDIVYTSFKRVTNKDLKYLNNSLGVLYTRFEKPDSAIIYFKKEIATHGNLEGAVSNLYDLYKERKDYTNCNAIIENKELSKYLDYSIRAQYDVTHFHFVAYCMLVFNQRILNTPLRLTIVSLLVALVWLIYLFLVDLKEVRDKWKMPVAFILGASFTFPCLFIYNLVSIYAHWDLTDKLGHDFLYCIFAIGCNEEFVKVLPVLLIAAFTKWIREPYEIILYVCASALGFAFMENLGYFRNEHFGTVFNRSLISVVSHMIYSSICVYGWILAKYKYKSSGKIVPYFLISFFIAACLHGIADFILIDMSPFFFLTLVIYLSLISVWVSIISNCINNSSYYSDDIVAKSGTIKTYIITCLTGILLLDYLKSSYAYGSTRATHELFITAQFGMFILGSLAFNLSKLHLMQGKWFGIKFFSLDRSYTDIFGLQIIISTYPYNNSEIDTILPIEGTVSRVVRSSVKSNEWLDIELKTPLVFNGQSFKTILLRPKSDSKVFIDDNDIRAYIMLPANSDISATDPFNMKDFIFYGWVILNIAKPVSAIATTSEINSN